MRNFLLILLLFSISNFLDAQNTYQQYTMADGLPSQLIHDVLIEDQNNIWVATDFGLSKFDGTTFTNYTKFNSSLNSNKVYELELAGGNLYMVTDSGMSKLDAQGNFSNYTANNGLLNSTIQGIASDLNGALWIATTSGVSKFNGTSFTSFPGKTAYDIEVDDNNRVYILRYNVVFNIPSFTQPIYEVYDGINWSSPPLGSFSETFSTAKIKKARNGQLLILGSSNFFAKLSYPFNLDVIRPESNGIKFFNYKDLEIDSNNQSWICGNSGGTLNVFKGEDFRQDSLFASLNLIPFGVDHRCLDAHDGVFVSGTNQGIFVGNQSIQAIDPTVEIDINSIRTSIDINGPFFNNYASNTAAFEFPKGNNSYGIYSAQMIIASKAAGNTSFIVNPSSPYLYDMKPGPVTNGGAHAVNYIVKVSKAEIDMHKLAYANPGYTIPHGILNWPANADTSLGMKTDLAPFFDSNNNGCYDPENGDYPAILGDEAIYWINNPLLNLNHIELHGMLYGYNSSSPGLNQVLFLKYKIINRSNMMLDSVKAGFFMDADVGNSADDYIGCDSLNNIAYAYNGDLFDENIAGRNGYGSNPPAVGVKFLSDSMDSHLLFNVGSGVNGSPGIDQHWVYYMTGRWQNGQNVVYGGNGFNSPGITSIPTKYMLTGDPYSNTGWTEQNPGGGQGPHSPGDRRSLSSIPFFSLAPGASKTIDLAVGYGLKSSTTQFAENVPELISVLNQAKTFYDSFVYQGFTYGTTSNCVVTSLDNLAEKPDYFGLYPNPGNGFINVKSNTLIEQIEIYDVKGKSVYQKQGISSKEFQLNLGEELKSGIYILRALDENQQWLNQKLIIQH